MWKRFCKSRHGKYFLYILHNFKYSTTSFTFPPFHPISPHQRPSFSFRNRESIQTFVSTSVPNFGGEEPSNSSSGVAIALLFDTNVSPIYLWQAPAGPQHQVRIWYMMNSVYLRYIRHSDTRSYCWLIVGTATGKLVKQQCPFGSPSWWLIAPHITLLWAASASP